ncbi:MAG: Rieske (2Fe-2S) protein [Gemmatimonadaceae bacterium]|jgi:nitrite reductase/ring-hydroxylating ferredoxin subunit|nr:Rieske (2Fe-2S) protein [Gemmatimonadaceae bacterium]
MSASSNDTDCGHRVDRREFVRRATLLAGGVLASLTGAATAHATARAVITEITPKALEDASAVRRYRVPTANGAFIDAGNELLIVRWNRQLFAFALACPHRGATLEWRTTPGEVYCPKHKARFDAGGAHRSGRASRDLDRYSLRLEGAELVVDLANRLRADRDASAWAAAVITL